MSIFDSHSRDQLRTAYAEAWAKHLARAPLTPLEAQIADVIGAHPEYQRVVSDADAALGFEPDGAGIADNPFLHMGLHLAVREQIAIDRPPGIRDLHRQFLARRADVHLAEHALMEALGEELWTAQRNGRAPDEQRYLAVARSRLAAAR
ncbi:MAG TPA: DUF1841 family protein [Steroidobacteraceae bacterium]|jgi:hypothetical protein|nr:DUF1841 family protein [Steroidobacteraceae bacterium]